MKMKQYTILGIQTQKQGDNNTQFGWGGAWK